MDTNMPNTTILAIINGELWECCIGKKGDRQPIRRIKIKPSQLPEAACEN